VSRGWGQTPKNRATLWRSAGGNIVATSAVPDASDASAKAPYLNDSDAPVSIWRASTRLRALWRVFPVVVRVQSSAWILPGNRGVRDFERRRASSGRWTVATAWQQTVLLHAVDDHVGPRAATQAPATPRGSRVSRSMSQHPRSGGHHDLASRAGVAQSISLFSWRVEVCNGTSGSSRSDCPPVTRRAASRLLASRSGLRTGPHPPPAGVAD